MTAKGTPATRLLRAIEHGSLEAVRMTVRELGQPDLETALRILLLIGYQEPETYERAAVRWAGKLMAERPRLGFEGSVDVLGELADLTGYERRVAASRLAFPQERRRSASRNGARTLLRLRAK